VQIVWAVSCDSYELHDDDQTADIYRAGFDTFYVDELPYTCEITILVRLLMEEGETGELEVTVIAASPTQYLGRIFYPVEADPGPNHRPGYFVGQIEALEVRFPAETEGIYSIELRTDSEHVDPTSERRLRHLFFYVRMGLPD
jgi:hypothetical protein